MNVLLLSVAPDCVVVGVRCVVVIFVVTVSEAVEVTVGNVSVVVDSISVAFIPTVVALVISDIIIFLVV